jgi:hypothetical protein
VRLALVLAVVAAGLVGAFFMGRSTVHRHTPPPRPGSYDAGYRAGREDAFSGFDGGWAFGVPYIVTLRKGPPGVTYQFARRVPLTRQSAAQMLQR